jgi:hypothetical protein
MLQKSFCITDHDISGLWARPSNKHGGPRHLVLNSRATSVTSLTAYQSAMATCFVFRRKISRTALWDFCPPSDIRSPRPGPRHSRFRSAPFVLHDSVPAFRKGTGTVVPTASTDSPLLLQLQASRRVAANRRLEPKPAVRNRSKTAPYSITSSATPSQIGGID